MVRLAQVLLLLLGLFTYGQPEIALLGSLPQEVSETSGLMIYEGKVYTHNDSGNAAALYEIDTLNFTVRRTIQVSGAENVDWEDLARDDTYLYIADIGNNLGNRRDLVIYRVPLTDLDQDTVQAESIQFSYADQTVFDSQTNSDWDAEALVSYGDELILFTKQWQSLGTVAYSIPKAPGEHVAQPVGSAALNGLVTGGTYNERTGIIYLLGYSALLQPFLFRLADLPDPFRLTEGGERYNLNIGLAQVEAIDVVGENRYFITSEAFSREVPPLTLQPSLYGLSTFDTSAETPGEDDQDEGVTTGAELSVFVPFGTKTLHYTLDTEREILGWDIFDTTGRRIDFLSESQQLENPIDISSLSSSIYYLAFYLQGTTIAKPFFLD